MKTCIQASVASRKNCVTIEEAKSKKTIPKQMSFKAPTCYLYYFFSSVMISDGAQKNFRARLCADNVTIWEQDSKLHVAEAR